MKLGNRIELDVTYSFFGLGFSSSRSEYGSRDHHRWVALILGFLVIKFNIDTPTPKE